MRALITRPREDAEALAGLLRERDIESVIEPMLVIRSLEGAEVDFEGVQALLLTSANGARALAGREPGAGKADWRHLRVFAVGNATAKANVDSATDTYEAAIKAEVVTRVGRTATDAAYVDMQDKMIEMCQMIASELADST